MTKLTESKSVCACACVHAGKGFCIITDPLISIALGARIFGGKKKNKPQTFKICLVFLKPFYHSLPLFALLRKTSWY